MKRILLSIAAVIGSATLQWLGWSFINWDLTWWHVIPDWNVDQRFFFMLWWGFVAFMSVVFTNLFLED